MFSQLRKGHGRLTLIALVTGACAALACTADPRALEQEGVGESAPSAREQALLGSDEAALVSRWFKRDRRPNILLIVADDLGYSDIGAFGGEIHTPNLDELAQDGKLLTQYYTSTACAPTRAGLISGTDHHLVGLGTMIALEPHQVGKPGYEGYLNRSALSFAELLRDSGYHTYIAGKWHLGNTEDQSPAAWGFESSFVLSGGGSTHFSADPPRPAESSGYREHGKPVAIPDDFYSTDFYTDKLIGYIEAQRHDGKPFAALATYTSPHWPLQATDEFIDRYRGRYDQGYAPIRAARIARQKRLGIIPHAFEPSPSQPSSESNPRWEELTPEQQRFEARRMELYAAMVENLDHNIGRILRYLKRTGEYDNTFIFFQSDNGAEAVQREPAAGEDNSYENLGRRGSYVYYGRRWAEVSATPFRQWKVHTTEGGISVPAIARLPRQRGNHSAFDGVSHVTDLAPTFLELAGVADPGSAYKGRSVHRITGHSLLPALERTARAVRRGDEALVDELFGRRYVRKGRWKLTWIDPPYGNGDWSLFDVREDRGETTDLAAEFPEVVADLVADWERYVAQNGVVLPNNIGIPAGDVMRPSLLATFVLGAGLAGLLGLHDAARAKQVPRASLGSRAACRAYSGLPPAFGVDRHAGMVWIEAGMFVPGSREGYAEERPPAALPDVAVAGFWIDRTEVTNAQFRVFVEATHYVTRAERAGESAVFRAPSEAELGQGELAWWRSERGANWRHPEGPHSDLGARAQHPVVHIAHEDALAYARWLGRSLPSEDQWEYAARAGLRSDALHRAPIAADGRPLANFWQGLFPVHDEASDGFAGRAPVGCYPESRFGLHDMIGNVWEWTRDRYRPRSDGARARASDAAGCESGAAQDPYVIKGGSFLCAANYCARYRVAARHAHEPATPTAHLGFRTVAHD